MLEFLKKIQLSPLKALLVRLVFATHCFLVVSRVVEAYQNSLYWLLLIPLIGLIVETTITILKRAGKEWTWFSPAIFFYLATAVPPIWLLEIQLSTARVQSATATAVNQTSNAAQEESSINSINIGVRLDLAGWALAMEQALLFILILGRWFMPKGNITRNQLSQLLLVYIGMAADIMELFEVFKEDQIALSLYLTYPTLSLWSLALLQYTLSISSTKAKKPRYGDLEESDDEKEKTESCLTTKCGLDSMNIDVIGIVFSILMQDGPFLCFRLYLLVGLGVLSQMMVFFTCKNILVILLQIYRLVVIYLEVENDEDDEENQPEEQNVVQEESLSSADNDGEVDLRENYNNTNNNHIVLEDEKSKKNGKRKGKVTPVEGTSSGPLQQQLPHTRRSWEGHDDDHTAEHPHSTTNSNGTA